MGIEYTDPDPAYVDESPTANSSYDECRWKTIPFPEGLMPGDDVDDPLEPETEEE
jgi:hypothetical protein